MKKPVVSVARATGNVAPPSARWYLAAAFAGFAVAPAAAQQLSALNVEHVAQQIVADTNELRTQHDRAQLEVNAQLTDAARYFAGFLSRSDRYDHTADGRRPEERARQHGYEYCVVSENIAYRFSTTELSADELARDFAQGWERSPGHRRNMLGADVTQTGVAVARNPQSGYYYAVQMFGRPWSDAVEFSVANASRAVVSYTFNQQSFPLAPGETRKHRQCGLIEWGWQAPDGGAPVVLIPKRGDRYTILRLTSGAWRLEQE